MVMCSDEKAHGLQPMGFNIGPIYFQAIFKVNLGRGGNICHNFGGRRLYVANNHLD
jgi:hypothetical protein